MCGTQHITSQATDVKTITFTMSSLWSSLTRNSIFLDACRFKTYRLVLYSSLFVCKFCCQSQFQAEKINSCSGENNTWVVIRSRKHDSRNSAHTGVSKCHTMLDCSELKEEPAKITCNPLIYCGYRNLIEGFTRQSSAGSHSRRIMAIKISFNFRQSTYDRLPGYRIHANGRLFPSHLESRTSDGCWQPVGSAGCKLVTVRLLIGCFQRGTRALAARLRHGGTIRTTRFERCF